MKTVPGLKTAIARNDIIDGTVVNVPICIVRDHRFDVHQCPSSERNSQRQ